MPQREKGREEEAKDVAWVDVRIVGRDGASVLAEWDGGGGIVCRVFVPADKIVDGRCSAENLERGIPYGVPWEELIDLEASGVTAAEIARKVRRGGIWTLADLRERDRKLIKIGTDLVGGAVLDAAARARAKGWEG